MAPEPTVSRRGRRRRRNTSRLAACCGWQSGMLGCQAPGSAQNACHVALHVAFKAALRTRQGRRGSGSLWLSFWPCAHLPLVPGPITAQEARHASDQSVRQVVQRHSPHTERHSAHMRAFLFLKQSGQGRWALPILSETKSCPCCHAIARCRRRCRNKAMRVVFSVNLQVLDTNVCELAA